MGEVKHTGPTPGPWRAHAASYGWDIFAKEDGGTVMQVAPWVASVTHPGPARDSRAYPTTAEAEANARLIAATPDLLEAAEAGLICAEADVEEAIQNCIEHDEDPEADAFVKVFRERAALIRAALSKAKGEDPALGKGV